MYWCIGVLVYWCIGVLVWPMLSGFGIGLLIDSHVDTKIIST